jgi:hypothetical protein
LAAECEEDKRRDDGVCAGARGAVMVAESQSTDAPHELQKRLWALVSDPHAGQEGIRRSFTAETRKLNANS